MPEFASSSQLLAAIVASSDDAIISKDLNGIITSWNPGAERIFGYTPEEAVGKSILMLIPQDRLEEEPRIIERIRRGERIDHFETTRQTKDGRPLEISLSVSPIRNADGTVVGASKIARDITERKQVERQLTAAKAELQSYAAELEKKVADRTQVLQRTIAELEAFSYSLTHDLRAPLRAIQSFLQIFLEDHFSELNEESRAPLQKAIGSTQQMDRLILDLLAFTRLSHDGVPIEIIDTEKVVRGIIQDRIDFQSPTVEITIQSPLENVMGNVPSLTQCLTNLLGNAVKFVAPGKTPRIKIYSSAIDSKVRLYVEDNGIGINPGDAGQLFQMFSRIHGTTYAGTGIGLAIVKKAAARMGGTTGVESEVGKGSRFWLELPKAL